jgi:hypothetical protein
MLLGTTASVDNCSPKERLDASQKRTTQVDLNLGQGRNLSSHLMRTT